MLYALPHTRVPDGTYTFNRQNVYGPSTPTTVVIHDGQPFALTEGSGEYVTECPVEHLEAQVAAIIASVAWHVRYGLAVRAQEAREVAA